MCESTTQYISSCHDKRLLRWEFKKLGTEEQVISEAAVTLAYIVDRKLENQGRQCMYNVIVRRVLATIVAVDK